MQEFKLPDPGEGLVEADIVTWRVAVGDLVKINDILVEIETSKSIVELPSPYAGTVTELLVAEGTTVEVGSPIITIDDGRDSGERTAGDDAAVAPRVPDRSGDGAAPMVESAPEKSGRTPNLVGYGAIEGSSKRRPRRGKVPAAVGAESPPPIATGAVDGPGAQQPSSAVHRPGSATRPKAKPPVRKLAKDRGVDLAQVSPTGVDGVITRDDVVAALQQSPHTTSAAGGPSGNGAQTNRPDPGPTHRPVPTSSGLRDERIPVKGVRKATAQAMVASAFTAPHVTEWVEVDVTASVEFLDRLRSRREFAQVKVSPTLLVAKAICLAATRTPEVNASWDEQAGEIVLHGAVNLGIAAATPRGLIVPNIASADQLGLLQLAERLNALVATARAGRTQPAEMSGGTITLTNIGVFGIDGGTPILNPGESAIVAVGQIVRKPWVVGAGDEERIEPRSVLTVALSFDHRLVDGEQGSRFLADVAKLLNDPAEALLY